MLLAIFPTLILFFALLGCLDGTLVKNLPELEFDSAAKAYQDGKNRLIVVHVDGLLPDGAGGREEKAKMEASLSKLAKDKKNEVCLISKEDVGQVSVKYSVPEGVKIVGNDGKRLFHPRLKEEYPAQKLPMDEIEAIKDIIVENMRRTTSKPGVKYKVKIGVNPLVIDCIPEPPEDQDNLDVFAKLLYIGTQLRQEHNAVREHVTETFGIWVDFEHGNDISYPLSGLKEEDYEIIAGDGATLTPLPRDFGLSVGEKGAESLHEAMNEAEFFSATVLPAEDNQTSSANSRLANINEFNKFLQKLADVADK